ncbi:MAG: hypothetical protein ACREQ7_22050 [Candidatus Binatia bacterium]
MGFDPQAILANLAEKEKIKGHHSPEGRAIRTVSRAMNGWSSGNLSELDALVLCDQAMEDWLKARLHAPPWSARSLPELLEKAVDKELIMRLEAVRLQRIRNIRFRLHDEGESIATHEAEDILEFCIQLLEKCW